MRRFEGRKAGQVVFAVSLLLAVAAVVWGQAGRHGASHTGLKPVTLPVILESEPSPIDQRAITAGRMDLYDGGMAQDIDYFRPDYSPAKVVVLVDNSETVRASTQEMSDAVNALAANLYEGDQMMVIGYDERPEIIEEFTDDRQKLEAATALFRKKDSPNLLDAIQATINDVFRLQVGISKRITVLISDGYDWQSRTAFKLVLAELARENIVVYVLQAPDRTHGAPRRRKMKPVELIEQLTRGTAGRIFPLKDAEPAAREIFRELGERWYQLSYKPKGVNPFTARRLLITVEDPAVRFRTKLEQPGERF